MSRGGDRPGTGRAGSPRPPAPVAAGPPSRGGVPGPPRGASPRPTTGDIRSAAPSSARPGEHKHARSVGHYLVGKTLGEGTFGKVCVCVCMPRSAAVQEMGSPPPAPSVVAAAAAAATATVMSYSARSTCVFLRPVLHVGETRNACADGRAVRGRRRA
jgi:hypothetical protein